MTLQTQLIFLILACPLVLSASNGDQSGVDEDAKQSAESLLEQLDHPKFNVRENATSALVDLGPYALEPAAFHYFNATPESAWRIKRLLEQIGVESIDEKTSLTAIGILMLIDNRMNQEIFEIVAKWRQNRSDRAVLRLANLGAKVSTQRQPQLFNAQRIFLNEEFTPGTHKQDKSIEKDEA